MKQHKQTSDNINNQYIFVYKRDHTPIDERNKVHTNKHTHTQVKYIATHQ